jgi:hypothetical protein
MFNENDSSLAQMVSESVEGDNRNEANGDHDLILPHPPLCLAATSR